MTKDYVMFSIELTVSFMRTHVPRLPLKGEGIST